VEMAASTDAILASPTAPPTTEVHNTMIVNTMVVSTSEKLNNGDHVHGNEKPSLDGKIGLQSDPEEPSLLPPLNFMQRARQWMLSFGPSWIVCAAYIDPGSIVSDFQQGAYTGYQILWVTFAATVIGITFQTLSFRLGLVTKKNLARLCSEQYQSRVTSVVIWIILEICTVLVDVQAVVGSAVALTALTGCPFWASCLVIIALSLIVVVFYQFWSNQTEVLAAALMIGLVVCFGVNFFQVLPPAKVVFFGWWVAEAAPYTKFSALGIFGALIMPNAIYLHSDLMIMHKFKGNQPLHKIYRSELYELVFSMLFTFFGNLMVICVFASAFFSEECAEQGLAHYQNNCTYIVLDNGLQDLSADYGVAFQVFFLVGLIATGLVSMINSTLAGQGITEGFLNIKLKFWQRLLITRIITLIPTLLLSIIPGNGSVVASILNEWINVFVNLLLPFAFIPAIHLSRKEFMGEWRIHWFFYYLLWIINWFIIAINIYFMVGFIYLPDEFRDSPGSFPDQPWFYSLIGAILLAYVTLIFIIIRENIANVWRTFVKFVLFTIEWSKTKYLEMRA